MADIEAVIASFLEREPAERETILRRSDDGKTWDLFTDSPSLIRRLEKLGLKPDKQLKDAGQLRYTLRPECVVIRAGKKKVSEEQREAARQRFKAMHAAKKEAANG